MNLIKSHAFGNDFLLVDEREMAGVADIPRSRAPSASGIVASARMGC